MMNDKISTCCTCGYSWPTGQNGSHQCSVELQAKIEKLEDLLKEHHLYASTDIQYLGSPVEERTKKLLGI